MLSAEVAGIRKTIDECRDEKDLITSKTWLTTINNI